MVYSQVNGVFTNLVRLPDGGIPQTYFVTENAGISLAKCRNK